MLKIDRSSVKLTRLAKLSLNEGEINERSGLQELIFQNPEAFFRDECDEEFFIIDQEVEPSHLVRDRIDLLAIDSDGKLVTIELKRGSDKLQLLQALSYTAMISDLTWDKIKGRVEVSRTQALEKFLADNDLDENSSSDEFQLSKSQRIVLIAESYDFEVLRTAQWLTEKYGLNITCYELALARDESSKTDYLSAVQLFPPKQLAEQARLRGAIQSREENQPPEVEVRLEACNNQIIADFFRTLLGQKPRKNKRRTAIVFPSMGKMRFRLIPRKQYARVVQLGRFEGDKEKWQLLSAPTLTVNLT